MKHLSFIRKQGVNAVQELANKYTRGNGVVLPEYRYQEEWSKLMSFLLESERDATIFATDNDILDYAAHRMYMLAQCVAWEKP